MLCGLLIMVDFIDYEKLIAGRKALKKLHREAKKGISRTPPSHE